MSEEFAEKAYTEIYNKFQNGHAFQNQLHLENDIERCVKFQDGEQWVMDEDTKDFPKIQLNVIKQVGSVRKSGIMQNEYSFLISSTNFKSIRKNQDFIKHLHDDVCNMRLIDLQALNDDYDKGTGIVYMYWDAQKRGFMRKKDGDVRCQIIDVRNFVVADPKKSIQDQEWCVSVTQEKISALKKRFGEDKDIVPDGFYYTQKTEKRPIADDVDDEMVNVYTLWYHNEKGEVLFHPATETCELCKPIPMNPYYDEPDDKPAPDTTSIPDKKKKKNKKKDKRSKYIWNLYPFVSLCTNPRDNCFYGIPYVMELLETQKSINNHFSVYDKAMQDNVLGGYMYRKGAVDASEITASNGNMVGVDGAPGEPVDNVLKRMPVANVPADSFNYSENLISTARSVAGSSNVQVGQADYAGQSGKQTQLLLERARENSSDRAVIFNEFKRQQAMLLFLFAKFYYDHEAFVVVEHGRDEDTVRSYLGDDVYNGTEYLEDDVYVTVKVGSSPAFSEYTNLELLGLMVQSGQLPFDVYVKMLPKGYISNEQEVLKCLESNSQKIIAQKDAEIEQMKQAMNQMVTAYKKVEQDLSNIDTIIAENKRLKSMVAEVSANAIKTVAESNQQVQNLIKEMQGVLQATKQLQTNNGQNNQIA